jgi:uncharacterized protein
MPCRHAERMYRAARGPKELWIVQGAQHPSALRRDPAGYEEHVIDFLRERDVPHRTSVTHRN